MKDGKFVLGERIELEGDVVLAPLIVNKVDTDFPTWREWYLSNHPEATRDEALHAAWHYGYRARIIREVI